MKYKLYTTYLSKLKTAPENAMKLIIMRFPPISFKMYKNTVHCPELSPDADLLMKYKKDNDFNAFSENYLKCIYNNEKASLAIDNIIDCLDNYNDIVLVCCEKDSSICHRTILAKELEKIGYKYNEL